MLDILKRFFFDLLEDSAPELLGELEALTDKLLNPDSQEVREQAEREYQILKAKAREKLLQGGLDA